MYISTVKIQDHALRILKKNDKGNYNVPNVDVYPFQWNWDAVFTAMGWLTFDEGRAWKELETLLEGQWENGLVPSIVFHEKNDNYFPGADIWRAHSAQGIDTTGITQIPILGFGLELMFKYAKDKSLAKNYVIKFYDKVYEYQRWMFTERVSKDIALIQIFHGWESMDNSPLWDEALERVTPTTSQFIRKDTNVISAEQRPQQWDYLRYISILERFRSVKYDSLAYAEIAEFKIIDAAFNAVAIASNNALIRLHDEYGFGTVEQSQHLAQWSHDALLDFDILWNDDVGLYVDYDLVSQTQILEPVSGGLLPIVAGLRGKDTEKFRHSLQKWIDQDLPSTFTESNKFEADRYWRGPSWTVVNFLIYYGALQLGYVDEATAIAERSQMQIHASGFYENFIPQQARGGGGTEFSWTAATYLYWLSENYKFDFLEKH